MVGKDRKQKQEREMVKRCLVKEVVGVWYGTALTSSCKFGLYIIIGHRGTAVVSYEGAEVWTSVIVSYSETKLKPYHCMNNEVLKTSLWSVCCRCEEVSERAGPASLIQYSQSSSVHALLSSEPAVQFICAVTAAITVNYGNSVESEWAKLSLCLSDLEIK